MVRGGITNHWNCIDLTAKIIGISTDQQGIRIALLENDASVVGRNTRRYTEILNGVRAEGTPERLGVRGWRNSCRQERDVDEGTRQTTIDSGRDRNLLGS
jgi:hypothetical protein